MMAPHIDIFLKNNELQPKSKMILKPTKPPPPSQKNFFGWRKTFFDGKKRFLQLYTINIKAPKPKQQFFKPARFLTKAKSRKGLRIISEL